MSAKLHPYLNFRDNARQAMEFYQSVFGGKLNVGTFKELNAAQDPGEEDLVMHASLEGDNGIEFFAADMPERMHYAPGNNFSMSLSGDDEALLTGWFDKLSEGGNVTMPLQKAVWGDTFGMLVDRFGVNWLVNIGPASQS
ncbi:MAG: VOC family protein [Candidatus Dormibacteraeota bacterium]|nr:VOC family protein [Candidatus Dormibacteraeota bacterium]MBV8300776.1 VOC family protein [Candidatus Dormibacteraeota bacterium]